jgi:hypothetical protein
VTRIARWLAAAGVLACFTVLLAADPASAHGVGGVQPSNFETRVLSMKPRVAGIEVRSVDLGDRLELTNTTGQPVIVVGYNHEPYLRVGPRGVFENVRSPAVYLNKTRLITREVPKSADANATPRWRRVSTSTTARWHDHRAHWMGRNDPPAVQRDPGRRQVVQRFTVVLEQGSRTIRVRGDLLWVPGPSPWPWVIGAVVIVATVFTLTRHSRVRNALVIALSVLVVSETAHVIGAWGATTSTGFTKLAASVYSLGGIALAVTALTWVIRRGTYAAAPLALLAGLFVAVGGGLSDVTALTRSQLPTTTAYWVTRLEVTLALGIGFGLAAAAGFALRPAAARRRV